MAGVALCVPEWGWQGHCVGGPILQIETHPKEVLLVAACVTAARGPCHPCSVVCSWGGTVPFLRDGVVSVPSFQKAPGAAWSCLPEQKTARWQGEEGYRAAVGSQCAGLCAGDQGCR